MFFQAIDFSFLSWPLIAAVYCGTVVALVALRLRYPIVPQYRGL